MAVRQLLLLAFSAVLTACAVDSNPAFRNLDETAYERTGHHVRWNQNTTDDQQAARAVDQLLSRNLTVDAAVEIAFLNNHELQATFENIGIAQADLVQAGLLHNPTFAASWRFPDRDPRQVDAEYSITQDFLELLVLPLRKKVAAENVARTQAVVGHAVLKLAAEVKSAWYTAQAQEQLLQRLKVIAEINDAASDLADKQHTAGTINDLDLANQQALAAQSHLELIQARIALTTARENLTRLMGLPENRWTLAKTMPDIPTESFATADLEELALRQRLDLAAAKTSVSSLATALGLTENFRYLTTLNIGVDTEHNPGGPTVTGPTLSLELPIFDQGQAKVSRAQAEYRRARQELLQLSLNIRSEVRTAAERLTAERDLALLYQNTLLPKRAGIVALTQQHYNAMLKGTFDLLAARQNQAAAERAYFEAWCDFWIARADLERAVGGTLTPQPAAAAASQPATQPADHSHSHGVTP